MRNRWHVPRESPYESSPFLHRLVAGASLIGHSAHPSIGSSGDLQMQQIGSPSHLALPIAHSGECVTRGSDRRLIGALGDRFMGPSVDRAVACETPRRAGQTRSLDLRIRQPSDHPILPTSDFGLSWAVTGEKHAAGRPPSSSASVPTGAFCPSPMRTSPLQILTRHLAE
jgi:hypothetical protein